MVSAPKAMSLSTSIQWKPAFRAMAALAPSRRMMHCRPISRNLCKRSAVDVWGPQRLAFRKSWTDVCIGLLKRRDPHGPILASSLRTYPDGANTGNAIAATSRSRGAELSRMEANQTAQAAVAPRYGSTTRGRSKALGDAQNAFLDSGTTQWVLAGVNRRWRATFVLARGDPHRAHCAAQPTRQFTSHCS